MEKGPSRVNGRGKLARADSALPALNQEGETVGAERFLVALPTSWDLLLCAKDLFVAAILAGAAIIAAHERAIGDLVGCCRRPHLEGPRRARRSAVDVDAGLRPS